MIGKLAMVLLLFAGMNTQAVGTSPAPLTVRKYLPTTRPRGCPTSSFTFNNRRCRCPKILVGTKGKGYWQTGNILETGAPFGPRSDTFQVTFSRPFCRTPRVALSLRGFDTEHRINQRIVVNAVNVTPSGFTVQVNTWADTKIYGVETTYVAVA